MQALVRLIVDADLLEADPARQPLEEAVALRHLPQRKRGARREQAEVAGILRNLVARTPVEQRVERPAAEPAQRGLVLAMRLRGVDDVVAVLLPVAHQRLDQRRRVLPVAVHEQHGAATRVIEAGGERRLLAEIARQRDHLHVERCCRKIAREAERVVAAAVVDVDHLDREAARVGQVARHLGQALVQARQALRLVVERNHDGKPGFHAPLIAYRAPELNWSRRDSPRAKRAAWACPFRSRTCVCASSPPGASAPSP